MDVRALGAPFWRLTGIAAVMTLARFSEAFLVLRAQQLGLAISLVPAVLVVMNIAYALSAYPAGALSDRLGRRYLLLWGVAVLIAADVVLALAGSLWQVAAGVVLWGRHMGLSQGLLAALVADVAPAERRGTAFGFFNLISGVALLAASAMAGWLWQQIGPGAAFAAGASCAALAWLGLLAGTPKAS
jgi:MFS family permease